MTETRSDAEILMAAKLRIADRGHYVMGALSWDRAGRRVDPQAPEAWRWSPCGAIQAECGLRAPAESRDYSRAPAVYRLLDEAARKIVGNRPGDMTENLGHADALRAFDAAIRACSGAVAASTPSGFEHADGGGMGG